MFLESGWTAWIRSKFGPIGFQLEKRCPESGLQTLISLMLLRAANRGAGAWEEPTSSGETRSTISPPLTFSAAGAAFLSSLLSSISAALILQADHWLRQRQTRMWCSRAPRNALAQTAHHKSLSHLKDMEELQPGL